MTGLEKILAEIENDAKEVANDTIAKAQEKADETLTAAKNEIEQLKIESEKLSQAKYNDIIERAKSSFALNSRKLILNKKQELIAKAIEEAKSQLINLPEKEYFEVLLKLVQKQNSEENATLALNDKDLKRVPSDFEKSLPSGITLSKTAVNIENGFVLIYDGIDINCSFDALFEDKMEELQDKSASILFK